MEEYKNSGKGETSSLLAIEKKGKNMTIKIYNSSDCLAFEGNERAFRELKANHLVNDSDRIVFCN